MSKSDHKPGDETSSVSLDKHFKISVFSPQKGQFASVFTDITTRKKAEEELKEREKNLRQSFVELAETTSRVLGVRDPYTQQHEQRVAEMTLHYHERLDGSGYPDGLEGDELTTEVRILGAVDVVEAMSTRRPYREARTKEETLNEIKEGKGEKYDPEVVDILIDMIEEEEIEFGGE